MRERQTILQFQHIIPILSEKSGVINENGVVIASNDENEVNLLFPEFNKIKSMDSKFFIYENYAYMRINIMDEKTYFLFLEVLPDDNIETKREILSLVALNIETAVNRKDTENNRDKLFRDLILEKIDMDKADILAFDLGIKKNEKRIVFCVEYFDSRVKDNISELLEELFEDPDKEDVYILTIDENHIALIVPYKLCREAEDMEELAAGIAESIETEFVIESKIGIGTIANGFSDIPKSYKCAQMAIEAGHVFDKEARYFSYDKLGVSKLIYGMPKELCTRFIDGMFNKEFNSILKDKELMNSIKMFMKCNLNLSVTSREMYIHRNTLVYRLEKIKKLSGFDLTSFEEAVIMKIGLMILEYMENAEDEEIK